MEAPSVVLFEDDGREEASARERNARKEEQNGRTE